MSLDLSNPALALSFLPAPLTVLQLLPSARVPAALLEALAGNEDGAEAPAFISLTRTLTEKSIILPSELYDQIYPSSSLDRPHEVSGPWSALIVAGPLDLSLSGILHELTRPLKAAEVPIFASSTWDTDYVLINEENKEKAQRALGEAGWKFAKS